MFRIFLLISILLYIFTTSSCNYGLGEFQQNEKIDYSLSTLLDDYPALHDLVYSLSLNSISEGSVALIYENEEAYYQTKDGLEDILLDKRRPAQNSIKLLKVLLQRLADQDSTDLEDGDSSYSKDFYSLIDLIRGYDFSLREDIHDIMMNMNRYDIDVKDSDELRDSIQDSIDNLTETIDKDLAIENMEESFAGLSKAFLQADYPLWVDGTDLDTASVVEKKSDVEANGVTNIGLGNTVSGMNSLLQGVFEIAKDNEIRDILKDIIRESGDATALTVSKSDGGTKEPWEVLKDQAIDYISFFTADGDKYLDTSDYVNGESSKSIYNTYDEYSSTNNNNFYSNSESRNLALYSNVFDLGTFLRSDRPESLISSTDETKKFTDPDYESDEKYKDYFLDKLLMNLRRIDFDPEEAHLEESLYDLIRFDTFGRDRRDYVSGGDWSYENKAWPVSYLEQFLFLSAMSQNAGWFDGGNTNEISDTNDYSDEHGHGDFAGGITMNDSLYAMGGAKTEVIGLPLPIHTYSLAFNNNINSIFRSSKTRFDRDGDTSNLIHRSHYKMGYNQNNMAQRFMSGAAPGDIGIPTGGNPDGDTGGSYNEFEPYSGDGVGDTNTSRFLLYWMVRTCWNGEGPYYYKPSTPSLVSFEHDGLEDTYEVIYRPNGQVYAFKKIGRYEYLYPSDGDDPEDPGTTDEPVVVINCGDGLNGEYANINGRKQRFNRYKSTWYSDYYMVQLFVDPLIGSDLYKTVVPTVNSAGKNALMQNHLGGRFKFEEMIAENDPDRACDSQIEAIYRNYQWLVAEKKMVIVVPMFLDLDFIIHEQAAVFQFVEGNGIAGLTGARKFNNNNVWAYQGDDNENSSVPGDHRIRILFEALDSGGNVGLTDVDMIWDSIQNGSSQPVVITHNVPGVYRFAFPRVDKNLNGVGVMGSKDFEVDESDPIWNKRNGLLPLVITSLGTILDNQNRDFSVTANRELTLNRMKVFTEALMSNIMPRFYYKKNYNTANYIGKTWIPRIIADGTSANHHLNAFKRSHDGSTNGNQGLAWLGWAQRRYFQPMPMRTPLNLLFDSNPMNADGFCDGILPLMMEYDVTSLRSEDNKPNTKILTKALKMLLKLGDEKFDDPKTVEEYNAAAAAEGKTFDDTYSDWGTRRKIFYGIEQMISHKKGTESELVKLFTDNGAIPNAITFNKWMFSIGNNSVTTNGFTMYDSYSNIRSEENNLNEGMNIAYDLMARSYEKDVLDNWESFERAHMKAGALMSKKSAFGEEYYVLDKYLDIFDKIFGQEISPTKDQIGGFLHTMGSLVSEWNNDPDEDPATEDGAWEIKSEEFIELITEHMVRLMKISLGEFLSVTDENDLHQLQSDKLAWGKLAGTIGLEHKDGTVRYVLNTLNLSDKFTTEDLFNDINKFLEEEYSLLTDFDSVLWPDVIQLMNDSAREIIRAKYGFDPEEFFGDDFQYNGTIGSYWDE